MSQLSIVPPEPGSSALRKAYAAWQKAQARLAQ